MQWLDDLLKEKRMQGVRNAPERLELSKAIDKLAYWYEHEDDPQRKNEIGKALSELRVMILEKPRGR